MCGRYASSRRPEDLIEEFEIDKSEVKETLAPDYNVAPTKQVYAVVQRAADQADPGRQRGGEADSLVPKAGRQRGGDADSLVPKAGRQRGGEADSLVPKTQRQLRTVKWGLVPFWAKDPAIGSRMINARMETVAEKPAFKQPFAKRRCLLPADGYYEWYTPDGGDAPQTKAGKPVKQPFFIHPRDGRSMAMAGLYEIWRDPTRDEDDPQRFLWTATVLTTTAEDAVGHIHDRMPLLVEPDRWAAWLDPATKDKDELLSLLVPAVPGLLEAYPVSTAVNSVRNNGPELIDPLPLEEVSS